MNGELQDQDSDEEKELGQVQLPTANNCDDVDDDGDDARNSDVEDPVNGYIEAKKKSRSTGSPSFDDGAKDPKEEKSQKLRFLPKQKQSATERQPGESMEHSELERNPTIANKSRKGETQPPGTLRFFRPKESGSSEGPAATATLPALVSTSPSLFGLDPSGALSEPGAIAVFPSTDFGANGSASNTDERRLVPNLQTSQQHSTEPQNETRDNTGLAVADLVDEDIPTVANAVDATRFAEKARKARQCLMFGFFVILVAVVIAASVIGIQYKPTASKAVESTPYPATSISPSSGPSVSPTLSREAYLRSLLPEPLSPQPLAFEWSTMDPYFENRLDWQIVQRYSLAAFYYSTNGDRWLKNTNWLTYNHSVCQWFNHKTEYLEEVDYVLPNSSVSLCPPYNDTALYQVEEDARVGEIYLGVNNLQGTLPDELYLLTDLRLLDFSGNQLEGTLSTRIHQLQNLTLLSLAANAFHGALPSEVGLVSSLAFSVLVSNTLEGTIPTGK